MPVSGDSLRLCVKYNRAMQLLKKTWCNENISLGLLSVKTFIQIC